MLHILKQKILMDKIILNLKKYQTASMEYLLKIGYNFRT